MKYCKYLLLLPLAFMAAGCSDENKEIVEEETQASSSNQLKSIYLDRDAFGDEYQVLWNVGETIPFCFENGSEDEQNLVRSCMCEWMQYANIKFNELKVSRRNNCSVRIKFDYSGTSSGGWSTKGMSQVGKHYNNQVPKSQPTMTIYSNRMKSSSEMRATILHELGHVLGLFDEHFNRNSGLTWNAANIKQDIGNAQYEKLFVEQQANCNALSVSGQFDPSSIMMYPIPARWNNQGRAFSQNYSLSAKDIATIKTMYPYPSNVVPIFSGSYSGTASVLAKFNQFTNKSDVRWLVGYGYTSQKDYTAPLYRYRHSQTGKVLCSYEQVKNGKIYYGNGLVKATGFVRIDNVPIAYVYVTMHNNRNAIVDYYTPYSPQGYHGYTYNMQTYYGCTAQPDNYIDPEHDLLVPGYWGALSAIAQ